MAEIEPVRRMIDESPVESLLAQDGVDEVVVEFEIDDDRRPIGRPVVSKRSRPGVDRDNAA